MFISVVSSSIYPQSESIKFAALDIRPARVRAVSTFGCVPIVATMGGDASFSPLSRKVSVQIKRASW